jgi:hypothetical protein
MLALTHPENWSPHACRAATRIFISTMKPPQAQLFLEVVLLDAMRSDISQNKKLNPQYYECLKRALFKPSAFFKGLIFPMLDARIPFIFLGDHINDLQITNRRAAPCEKRQSLPLFLRRKGCPCCIPRQL